MAKRRPSLKLISKFQYQSILMRTSMLLILFTLFVVGSIYYLFRSMAIERYKDASYAQQHVMMTRTSDALETALMQRATAMDRLFADQSVTGLLISPNRSDNLRLVRVMGALSRLVTEDSLIKRAHLYIFSNDLTYSSDGSIRPIMKHDDRKMIISCLSSSGISSFHMAAATVGLMVKEGRTWLFIRFPNELPLGVLVAELESDALYRMAVGVPDGPASYRVNVFEQNHLPLFQGQTSYPDILGPRPVAGFRSIPSSNATLYCYVSDKTGFTFITAADNAGIVPSFRSIMQSASPFFALFAILIILFAIYLVQTTYKPIQAVIYSMVADGNRGWNARENEADFIRDAYRGREETIGHLRSILSTVAPAVTERAFSSLLAEGGTREESAAMLQSIGSDFSPDSRYIALVMVPVDADFRAVEHEINVARFSDLWYHHWENKAYCYFLRQDEGLCVGILSFPENTGDILVLQMVERFREAMRARCEEEGHYWLSGAGSPRTGIAELRKSYLEAREDLGRLLYYRQGRGQPEQDHPAEESDADLQGSISYYSGRMRQMIDLALGGHDEDARAGLSMLGDVASLYPAPDKARRIYQNLCNALIEEMIKYQIDPADVSLLALQEKNAAEMASVMFDFCEGTFAQLQAAAKRGHNKYADSAKRYIADHYFHSSLSLDQVSRHVGITSPYLSKIFAESTGEGFLDYLNQYRIDRAKQLLSATDLTVSEIGYKVGFQSPQSFARVFKRHMKQSPSGYREANKMQQKRM